MVMAMLVLHLPVVVAARVDIRLSFPFSRLQDWLLVGTTTTTTITNSTTRNVTY